MIIAAAILCGFVLDLVLGDPDWMPHPVVIMGKWILRLENLLRRILPKTSGGELAGGVLLVILVITGTLTVTAGVCMAAAMIHPVLGFVVQTLWCWQALAIKGLKDESVNVYRCLMAEKDDEAGGLDVLEDARRAVGRIVGRDTDSLSREGVIQATMETIAENFSDGVLAPLFYLAIGGAPLGLTYKAINTMDSMVGYKNERYLYFGRAAARLDDAAGYIPSRMAALFFIAATFFAGGQKSRDEAATKGRWRTVKNAWRIWRRDRRNHASPNSAQTEAACAGALGVRLAGPACYFGKRYDKPYIGDDGRPVEAEDIFRTIRLMYAAAMLSILCFVILRITVTG